MVEDWETGMLYLNEEKRLGSQRAAAESVRAKYLNDVFSPKRDTRLFMGTTHPYNTWDSGSVLRFAFNGENGFYFGHPLP